MALHEQSVGATDEWYTPPYIFAALGCVFDMDVASPGAHIAPWVPAEKYITRETAERPWEGFVWMNAPFGGRNGLLPWLDKFFLHGNGVALVPDRTSAPWWQMYAPRSDLILFVAPKIKFIDRHGREGASPAQGTTLLAVGRRGREALLCAARNKLGVAFVPCS